MADLERALVTPAATIREVMTCIDRFAKGIALVVDERRRLIATVTDGDVRRAILAGVNLDTAVSDLLAHRPPSSHSQPITAPRHTPRGELLKIMQAEGVRQMPLLDESGRVAGLMTLDELLPEEIQPIQAVIMAGGFGTRLHPLTDEQPKPMLPVGDRPLMERTIEKLRQTGIRRVCIATHHLREKITEHFGDGRDFGVDLSYLSEERPLGTAGALGLMETPGEPILVINGDILTQIDFRAMLAFHREAGADLTVAVRQYDLQVPYGVIECDGPRVTRVREKPQLNFFVNAGIYLLEPSALRLVPRQQRFDMTDLIELLLNQDRTVASFPVIEYWLDIGQPADYTRAQEDVRSGEVKP